MAAPAPAKGPRPQDTDPVPTKAVNKGDTLTVSAEFLTAAPVQVEWSQGWSTRNQKYYYSIFENSSQGNDKGRLFINEASLENFKHSPLAEGKYTFKVNEEFQYGQASEGKDRFLVFHNKNNTPYQHRFVKSVWVSLGQMIGSVASQAVPGGSAVKTLAESALLSAFGDPLRNF